MSIVLQGSTSGSITLQEPAVAGSTVLDLPATSGTLITTGSSGQSIPKAALPTGSVLQVVSATTTSNTTTTSTSFVTGNLSGSITPTSSSSKILIMCSTNFSTSTTDVQGAITVYRDATNLMTQGQALVYSGAGATLCSASLLYYDSPATTSSTTYTIYFKNTNNAAGTITFNSASASGAATAQLIIMEIAA